jgi:hypothetical protein
MLENELTTLALEHIRRRLGDAGPPDARLVHCEARRRWDADLLRTTSQHKLHVLARAADIIVYFDRPGRVTGWRDDGRTGAAMPAMIDRDALLTALTDELGLTGAPRLGRVEPKQLPPLGWTHQAVLLLAPTPTPAQTLTAWLDPNTLKVIQTLRQAGAPDAHDDGAKPQAAARIVHDLLARRLQRAKISTSRPEWFFQVEPAGLEPFDGGAQVRVRTWRHWSDASVTYQADDGELLADVIDRFAAPPADADGDRDALIQAALMVGVPADAELAAFDHTPFAQEHRVTQIQWLRRHDNLRVDGDFLEMAFHPHSARLVSLDRKWRTLRINPRPANIDSPQAVAAVRRQRAALMIPPDLTVAGSEKALIEYKTNRDRPGPTEDRVAWIVTLTGPTGWAHVHVDADTGEVLAVLRSA